MMTREEYKAFYESFQNLKMKCDLMDVDLSHAQDTINRLWNELNRPAIEALQAKHDAEFYDWCDEMAEKYNRLEEEEWLTDRAKFYNNGVYDFCQKKGISEEEAYAHRQYYDGIKFWSESSINSGLMDEELEATKTEGWSDLPYFKTAPSMILYLALNDVFDRYKKNLKTTGILRGPYWHLWKTFEDMSDECECLGNGYYEFKR